MKKQLICLLTICLLLTCFTACGQQKVTVTPTDISSVAQETVLVEESEKAPEETDAPAEEEKPVQDESKEIQKPSKTESKKETNKQQTAASKKPAASTVSSQPQESTVKPYDGAHADLAKNLPTFYKLESLEGWLTNGTQRPEHRDAALSLLTTNKKAMYYQPKGMQTLEEPSLAFIEVDRGEIYYYFQFQDDPVPEHASLYIAVGAPEESKQSTLDLHEEFKQNAKNNVPGFSLVNKNGIEYTLLRDEEYNETMIFWIQNGIPASASLTKHYDYIDTVFELCQLTAVTFTPQTDHVIQ